jgi:colanic acid biosynthesis protein WcaH
MNHTGKLKMDDYIQACGLTQLVSVDLLIKNEEGKYLLGMRRNSPAKNTYFVPGCRAYKGESIRFALIRTMKTEIGCLLKDLKFYGMYEQMYENDNPGDVKDLDTHYVVFAYEGTLPASLDTSQFQEQHSDFIWMTPKEIVESQEVHIYTKYYFFKNPQNRVTRANSLSE